MSCMNDLDTDGKFKTIDAIESWGCGFHLGNAVEYISQAGKEDHHKKLENLKKALWYAERISEKKGLYPCGFRMNYNGIDANKYCEDKGLTDLLRAAVIGCAVGYPELTVRCLKQAIEEEEKNENH